MSAICPYLRCLAFSSKHSRWVTFSSAEWLEFSGYYPASPKNVCLVHRFKCSCRDLCNSREQAVHSGHGLLPQTSRAKGGDLTKGNHGAGCGLRWGFQCSRNTSNKPLKLLVREGSWNQKVDWSQDVALLNSVSVQSPIFPPQFSWAHCMQHKKYIAPSQAVYIGDFLLNLRIGANGSKLFYLILSMPLAIRVSVNGVRLYRQRLWWWQRLWW